MSVTSIAHGTRVLNGKCYDCSQGMLRAAREGFEYWNEDRDRGGFWFCRYCGSNHVTIVYDNRLIEQTDLYDADGWPSF